MGGTITPYAKTIRKVDPTVNPIGVEASMRLQYGTLDHLSRGVFRGEIELAKACEREEPGFMRSTACSFGRGEAFDQAEKSMCAGAHPTPSPRVANTPIEGSQAPAAPPSRGFLVKKRPNSLKRLHSGRFRAGMWL